MKIKIRTFASVYDICGFTDKEIEIQAGQTVADVVKSLIEQYSDLSDIVHSLLFAVNEEYCAQTRELVDDDLLAIFPPVSGG